MKIIGTWVTAAMLMATAGCVSMGPNYSDAAVDQLVPGMSKADVVAKLGRPTTTLRLADGQQQLMWVHARGNMLGQATSRALMLNFTADGRYVGMASQAETHIQ